MPDVLLHRLREPLCFLSGDRSELERLFPALLPLLPHPRPILFQPGAGAPLHGFPLLDSRHLDDLDRRLSHYLRAEAIALATRQEDAIDRGAEESWVEYRELLLPLAENVATTSYARDYPQIFWLFHSLRVAEELAIAERHGDGAGPTGQNRAALRYRILTRYLGRLFPALYDLAERIAREEDELEVEVFPRLLGALRDNLLIFGEARIDSDLEALDHAYFEGYLGLDAADLRRRFERLVAWQEEKTATDADAAAAVEALLPPSSRRRFFTPGFVRYLSALDGYDPERFLTPQEVHAWEALILRLKEYELLDGLRRLVVRLTPEEDQFRCDPRDAQRIGARRGEIFTRTRPIDFLAPWLVDPEVSRGGLIYDITKFTATVGRLSRDEHSRQDRAFRSLVRFQRRHDQLARSLGLRFEKYLGDGAFYSAVELERLLLAALVMQQSYRQAIESGFPFREGIRIALNYGDYRLMPFGDRRHGDARYEAFGQGVVELTRLVSGKPGPTLEEIRTELVRLGFDEWLVRNFLAPMERRRGLGGSSEPRRRRPFRAFIEHDGTLANEGIVATRRFLVELSKTFQPQRPRRGGLDGSVCVVFELGSGERVHLVALRKLGIPNLKGLEDAEVYEVVDARAAGVHDLGPCREATLIDLLEEAYNATPIPLR